MCSEFTRDFLPLLTALCVSYIRPKRGNCQSMTVHFLGMPIALWTGEDLNVENTGGPAVRSPAMFLLLGLRPK